MLRYIRRLYYWAKNDPVDEDLRGWSWDKPPIKPRAYLGLGVYEVAGKYCPTRRDIWLRRKMGVKPSVSKQLLIGRVVHEAIRLAIKNILKELFNEVNYWEIYDKIKDIDERNIPDPEARELFVNVYRTTLITILGEISYEALTTGSIPQPLLISEYKVDGTLVGLSSKLSIDTLAEGIIIDYKYGEPRDFHKLGIAGYALALESEYEIPFDYGLLVYINNKNKHLSLTLKPVYVSNMLRRWFLEERDNIIEMFLNNEEPPIDTKCKESCPYYKVCHP